MQANRRRDTGPEKSVRSELFARGLRYRVDLPIRSGAHRPIRADVVFPARKVAVFIDGCFWHGCPVHGTQPTRNADYWTRKIEENRERDARHTAVLRDAGWTVIRAWEHETPASVADRICAMLEAKPRQAD